MNLGIYAIVIAVVCMFAILGFSLYPLNTFINFLSGFIAGVLGILLGFLLDRGIDYDKDKRLRDDFLNLIRDELKDIKGLIYPQVPALNLLYTEIWDSAISSGVIRLLNTEQVAKLSTVYKAIKGTSYEAEWVRRDFEELASIPDSQTDLRKYVQAKWKRLRDRHRKRMESLTDQINDVLKEGWWANENDT